MHRNPAVQICHQLNEKQVRSMKKILMEDKRSASLKLFNLIKGLPPKDISKEDLYQKLYGTAYEASRDYLLRNELRLLRQKLDKFLLQKSMEHLLDEDEVFRQRMTLQAYKHFKLYDLFFEGFEKAEAAAEESFRFGEALELQNWYLDLAYQHQFSTVRNYEEKAAFFSATSEKARQTLSKLLVSQWRIGEFYQALECYYLRLLGQTPACEFPDKKTISFELEALDHPLSLYYHHRTIAFYTEGRERLSHFLKAYKALQTHTPKDKHIADLLINILLGIGRTLQQLGDFAQADLYLSKAFNDYASEIPNLASREKLYANYIINLLNIGEYEKTLSVLHQLQKEVSGSGYAQYWYSIYKLTAYIGLRKTAEIKQGLPANYTAIPLQHRIYFRIISSIYFYLTGELEWAYKEAYNLLHTKLAEEYGKEQLAITELLETFFQFIDKYSNLKQLPAKESKKLEQKLNSIDTCKINDINILPVYLWLRNEINRTIQM